jgi:hypothetical protein
MNSIYSRQGLVFKLTLVVFLLLSVKSLFHASYSECMRLGNTHKICEKSLLEYINPPLGK